MFKNWTKKETYLLVGVITAVLIIYGSSYFSIIKPMKAEVNSLAKEVSMYETQYEKINNQSERTSDENLSSVELQVPSGKSPDSLLVNIQKIADSSNVTINHIGSVPKQQEEEESSSGLNEAAYTMDAAAAKLNDMNGFLDSMVDNERLMVIDTITIQQEKGSVFLTIVFKTYYSK